MAQITIEVYPWLTDFFERRQQGKLVWEEEIIDGITLRDLLGKLRTRNSDFIGSIYDQKADLILNHINLIINDQMLNMVTALDEAVRDGDRVTFVPGFSGG